MADTLSQCAAMTAELVHSRHFWSVLLTNHSPPEVTLNVQ